MKYLLIVLLATVTRLTCNAQIQIGIKAGANFSTLAGFGNDGSGTKVGFQGGAIVAIPFASSFCLQPEANFSMEGNKSTSSGITYRLNQNYLNVLVLVKYKHESGLFAESGPQIGYLMSAAISGGAGSGDVKSVYKPANLSWVFGLGYLVKSINTGIDVRYNVGLTNIISSNYGSGGSLHSSVIQVSIFYLLASGK